MRAHRLLAVLLAAVLGSAGCSFVMGGEPAVELDPGMVDAAMADVSIPELGPTEDPGDGVVVTTEPPPTTAPPEPPRPPDVSFDGGYFDENSDELTGEGQQRCASFAAELRDRTGFVAFLGFADTRSTTRPGGNEKLSEDRARTLANCLSIALASIGSELVTSVVRGMGTACPRDPDPEGAANRRVEVFVSAERVEPRSDSCPP